VVRAVFARLAVRPALGGSEVASVPSLAN